MIIDKHVHTPYCPHGSTDTIVAYIEQSISLNYKEISFTEHAPLPLSFHDPTPKQDSAMPLEHLPNYLAELKKWKHYYASALTINIGLEVDFIEGYEKETTAMLNEYGHHLDDSILSVHFLKHQNDYFCMDYSEDTFGEMIRVFGGISNVYASYFSTLRQSIESNLGNYKPRRIGHMTLVEKFKRKYPSPLPIQTYATTILDAIAKKGYELDYNGAGFSKPLCLDSYPPSSIASEAHKRKIPLIYGSDAHSVKGLAQGYQQMNHSFFS